MKIFDNDTIKELSKKLVIIASPEEVQVGTIEAESQIFNLNKNKIIITKIIRELGEMAACAENDYNKCMLGNMETIDDDKLDSLALTRSSKDKYCRLLAHEYLKEFEQIKNHKKYFERTWESYNTLEQAYKKLRFNQ